MMNGFEGHGWGMGFAWLLGVFVLALFIWLVVKITNQNNNPQASGNKSALDILKERYALGEIDKEEFNKRKKDLL